MIQLIVIACLFTFASYCAADEPVEQPVAEQPNYAQLLERIDQLERRIVELERQQNSHRQLAPKSLQLPNSQLYRTPTTPVPPSPNLTRPPQGTPLQPIQTPQRNVPKSWQRFYFNGQWFYIVPVDSMNPATTSIVFSRSAELA